MVKTGVLKCFIREMSSKENLKKIFLKSIQAVEPQNLIKSRVRMSEGHLSVMNRTFSIQKPCYVVGFGKAVLGMALELERTLGDNLKMGVVTVPEGILKKQPESKLTFIEGAKNNIPDEKALAGAWEIKKLVEGLTKDDLLIVLISGGGSALLPLPIPPITLREKQDLIKELSSKGANILELNCVRKQISSLKGGGLAKLAYPCKVISLVLSDIVGDPLDFIASGPTTPNFDKSAIETIRKYISYESLPESIRKVLENKNLESSPPIRDAKYEHVENFIIGNNQLAADAAMNHAVSLGFQSAIISTSITGNVSEISKIYAGLASVICNSSSKQGLKDFLQSLDGDFRVEQLLNFDFSKEICLIAAGEPTVVVQGSGKGGRNQQLALQFSVELNKLNIKSADISFLSGGTDGMDGPTDAAGAIGTLDLVNNALAQNIKPQEYLTNNDSYSFYSVYSGGADLIKTGHTGTNVMDIHLLYIKPK